MSVPVDTIPAVDALGGDGGSDEQLVGRVRGGDPLAFAALYRIHVAGVRTAITHHVAGPEAIADAVQETFVRALERLSTLRQADHFRPWLLAIARHTAIDVRRLRDKTDWLPDEAARDRATDDAGPDTVAELAELAALVNERIAELPPRDAYALALVTHLSFSPAEVAATLGVTPGTAKVIVHRARRRLSDALALELMVRRRGAGCDDFAALFDAADMAGAARHVSRCAACRKLASTDVALFAFGPGPTAPARQPID
jgi:RNA polymerase sigma factor (sigma-70 family)